MHDWGAREAVRHKMQLARPVINGEVIDLQLHLPCLPTASFMVMMLLRDMWSVRTVNLEPARKTLKARMALTTARASLWVALHSRCLGFKV